MNQICPNCGYLGDSKTVTKGSIVIELVLWLCMILPGLIYSIWRLSSRHTACPSCGAPSMIPVSSPRGRQLVAQFHPDVAVTAGDAGPTGSAVRGRIYIGLILVGALVYVVNSVRAPEHHEVAPSASDAPRPAVRTLPVLMMPETGTSLGKWVWTSGKVTAVIVITDNKGKFTAYEWFTNDDGSRTPALREVKSSRGRRFLDTTQADFGEYFLILKNGELEVGDKSGPVGSTRRAL